MGGGEDHSEPLSPSSTQQFTLENALLGYKHLEVALISFVLSSRIDPHIKKKKIPTWSYKSRKEENQEREIQWISGSETKTNSEFKVVAFVWWGGGREPEVTLASIATSPGQELSI